MSIETLLIYGSHARGDSQKNSDVDLLAMTNDSQYQVLVNGNINTVCYPKKTAFERAGKGDLFFLHVVEEAKVLYDIDRNFEELRAAFKYKDSYKMEIKEAADLGWYLLDVEPNVLNYTLLNRRIAWCVRTILIAQSAENRHPVFSARSLALLTDAPFVEKLIFNKNENIRDVRNISYFLSFLNFFGLKRPIIGNDSLVDKYKEHFALCNNEIGLKTLKNLNSAVDVGKYIF